MGELSWVFFPVFFTGLTGLLVALILLFVNRSESYSTRLLAFFLLSFSFLAVNFALMTSRFYVQYPHFWRILGWTSFCYAPLGYLYVRSVLEQSFTYRKKDLLLFIPALLHFIGLIPFYIKSAAEKSSYIEEVSRLHQEWILKEPESMWPIGTGAWLRALIGVIAVAGQFQLLHKWKKNASPKLVLDRQNVETTRWLQLFTWLMAAFWLIIIVQFIMIFGFGTSINGIMILTISAAILITCIYLLVQPSILYGIRGWNPDPQPGQYPDQEQEKLEQQSPPEESKKNTISFNQSRYYKEKLESHLTNNQTYRKRGYTVGDLSAEIGIPAYVLSTFINQEYGKNFNELINEYRVDYLLKEVSRQDLSRYTMEALGNEAGFNSRAAFISAVKKFTGKNPSEVFAGRNASTLDTHG